MLPFSVIKHKGTAIVLSDMSNTNPQEAMQAAMDLLKKLATLPKKSALLMIDLTNSKFDKQSVASWMQVAPQVEPYVKSMAIVGAEKLLKIIVENVTTTASMPFVNFGTRLEAMDYLTKQV
jgi:hypothetical protein